MRSLLLLRHAQTEDSRRASSDHARRLTAEGERQAAAVGDHLRELGTPVDLVVCSPATRARQTALAVGATAPVEICDRLYNAGGDEIIGILRELADDVAHVLVVAHAPGLPAVVYELADPDSSDPDALATIDSRFPAGTLATLAVTGPWSDLRHAALTSVRLP